MVRVCLPSLLRTVSVVVPYCLLVDNIKKKTELLVGFV